jgi:PAS domain S-box-containing protein
MTNLAIENTMWAALLDGQRRILDRIASGAPLAETLMTLIRLIEEQAEGMRCAVLLADAAQQSLRFVAAPSIPEDYKAGIVPYLRIAPNMGWCGTAAFVREPVYTEDTGTDVLCEGCGDIALRNDLRAIWSTPILGDDNVVQGTFAMYCGEPRLPSPEHIKLIDMAVQMARVAMEAKRSEDALRKSEDSLRMVIDTIPAMAWSVLPDGTLDFLNQRWLDYAGLSLEEAIAEPTRTVHSDDLPRAVQKWSVDIAAGDPYEHEMRLRRADGEYRWFLIRIVPLRDGHGNIIKWYGTGTDIEDRKRAEDALRRSEDRLRHVVDTIPAIVWSALPDGAVDFVNDRWLQYTDLSREDSLGWRWTATIHRDDFARATDYWRTVLLSGEPAELEQRLRRSDGEFRWFLCRYVPVRDDSGKIVRWYATCTDIEDRKQAEDTLRRNQAFFAAEAQRIGGLLKTAAPGYRHERLAGDEVVAPDQRGAAGKSPPGEGAAKRTIPEKRRLIAERQAIESLTSNERSIIRLIAEGKSNAGVADLLHLSPRTVETYRARLMQKLQLEDLVALVKFAIRNGMSSVD